MSPLIASFTESVVALPNASWIILDGGYQSSSSFAGNTPLAGAACSTPYNEIQYIAGLNTAQSTQGPVTSPFVPSHQTGAYIIPSVELGCFSDTASPVGLTCLCSPKGSCYYLNETETSAYLYFYAWCGKGNSDDCATYLGACANGDNSVIMDVATGKVVTSCGAINNDTAPLNDCYSGSTNCTYLPIAFASCGPCSNATLELDCDGPIDLG